MNYRKLDIFDFDGTLFDSPEQTQRNMERYEKHTGVPWLIDKQLATQLSRKLNKPITMRRGWWGRAETLEPPLVPCPAPPEWFKPAVCEALRQSMDDAQCRTLILTGRHQGLKNQVLRICADGNLFSITKKGENYRVTDDRVTFHFLGDNGPAASVKMVKPSGTFEWKIWIIEQYLDLHPTIEEIEIWEDRDEHVKSFSQLSEIWPVEIKINHIPK